MRGSSSRHSGGGGGREGNNNNSNGGGRAGDQRSKRGGGHSHGQNNPTAAPFKLLTRTPQDAEIISRGGGGIGPPVIMAPPPAHSLQPPQQQQQQQQGYPNYVQSYQYSSYPNPPPPPPQMQQQQQQIRGAVGRLVPQQPQTTPSFIPTPPGLGGVDGGNTGMSKGVVGSVPQRGTVSGSTGGRRERSNSVISQNSSISLSSAPQQLQQQPSQNQQHSQQSESDASDVKPRRRDRQRRNRKGQDSGRDNQSSNNNSNNNNNNNPNSNDGSSKPQPQQAPHRVIVDPNSFQRQIIQPNPNSSGGSGGVRGSGELYDDDVRGSESTKGSSRRQILAGRTVYSWQGASSNQQQQHQQQHQQQQQQQQQQHQQLQALPPHLQPRGSAGPFSMPGTKDQRSTGGNGPHSAGGSHSAGGRLLPTQQVVAMPPPMGAHSVKLMNDQGKFQEGVEQWMSEHPGHFVVGILGSQGVGKSSLLSSFCPSHLASAAFTKQPPQMAAVAGYQTSGIDMYITPERMILLDTEPIFSLSNLENALRNERVADGIPTDIWLDQQALILATFLISVCNVVLYLSKDDEPYSTKSFRLLQRVEVFMKALSSSSSATQGGGSSLPGQGLNTSGQTMDGFQRDGLGEWCADIVFISNKVPPMAFGPDHYRDCAAKQALLWQDSHLQLFGSINMATIYPRFEDTFSRAPNTASVMTTERRERLSQLSDDSGTLSESESEEEAKSNEEDLNLEPRQPLQPQEIALDEKKLGQQLNFVMLPLDSTLVTQSLSKPSANTISNSKRPPPKNRQQNNQATVATVPPPLSSLYAAIAPLSVNLNRHSILGNSYKSPDHDVFAGLLQDQERWSIWTKGLRNKILSLSMRPQGGPALGPRNRPGMVSEREWLRYATRTWDIIRKADFLVEYVRAAKLSRDG